MGKIDDDTIRENAGALMAIHLGNGLLMISWMLTAALGVTAFLAGHIAATGEGGGIEWGIMAQVPVMPLLCVGVTIWPAGIWLMASRLRGRLDSQNMNHLRAVCRHMAIVQVVCFLVSPVAAVFGRGLINALVFPVAANLLTLIYPWYLGHLAKRLEVRAAWVFWLWAPICALSTVFYFTGAALPLHWISGLILYSAGSVWLGAAAFAAIIIPILIAHLCLGRAVKEGIRRLKATAQAA